MDNYWFFLAVVLMVVGFFVLKFFYESLVEFAKAIYWRFLNEEQREKYLQRKIERAEAFDLLARNKEAARDQKNQRF